MTHPMIPTIPTLRDERMSYRPRHRKSRRVRAVPHDSPNNARCTGGEVRGGEDGFGRLLIRCKNGLCPRHEPVAYADARARHTPQSLVMRHGMLLTLGEAATYGDVDVTL